MDAMIISGDSSPVDVSCDRDRLAKQNTFIIYRQTSYSLPEGKSQLDLVALLKKDVTMCIDEKVKQEVEETVKQKVDTVRQELESTVAKLQNENKDANDSSKLLNELNDQKEKLNAQMNEYDDKIHDMQTQIDTLQHNGEKTNAELEKCRNEVQQSAKHIKELRANARQLEIALSEESRDKKKLKTQLDWYKGKLESIVKENKSLKAMLKTPIRQNVISSNVGHRNIPQRKSHEWGFPKINNKR